MHQKHLKLKNNAKIGLKDVFQMVWKIVALINKLMDVTE